MKLLRYLKVLSITVAAVALVGSLVVFALVPRDALVDYFPVLEGILPPPAAKPKPVEPKAPVVTAVKKPEHVTVPDAPSSDEAPTALPEPEQSPEPPIEEGAGEVDLDGPDALEKIAEKATNFDDLRVRKQRGVETASDMDGPFTGWAKRVWSKNGQLEELGRYEDGLRDGLWVEWQKNGQKRMQGHYKLGQQEGVWTQWKSNGVTAKEFTYVDGKKSRDPIKRRLDARRLNIRELPERGKPFRLERFPRK